MKANQMNLFGYRVMDHEFGYFEGFDSDQANVMVDGWFGGLSFDF